MALDIDVKKKIRNSLDYECGGRLNATANTAVALDAPVLIVGLGGTGADAVIRVKKLISDRMKGDTKNIEYFVLDTDIQNENISYGGVSFDRAMDEIFIFNEPYVQKMLYYPLPSYIDSWINKDISQDKVINGTEGVRQLGRLMLFKNIDKVLAALNNKIRRVTASHASNVPLNVFLVSGLGGGTGGGTFIDIPYIIKEISRQINSSRPVNTIGMLFLPDVNLSRPGLSGIQKESIKKNGFAALKELDYLMNVDKTGDAFQQDYGNLRVGYAGDNPDSPFLMCILMSAKDEKGVAAVNAYRYALNMAAETLFGFVDSLVVDFGGTAFRIHSFCANSINDCNTFVHMLGDDRHPVNYRYTIAGISIAKFPMDEVMSYMAYLAFKEVDTLWDRTPSNEEVKDVLDSFGIDVRNQEVQLCYNRPEFENKERFTYQVIRENPDLVINEYNKALSRQKSYLEFRMNDMSKDMMQRINDYQNMINRICCDPNNGPLVAHRLLFTFSDRMSVTNQLKEMKSYFLAYKPSDGQLDVLRRNFEDKLQDLLNNMTIFHKARYRDGLMYACDEYYGAQFKRYVHDCLAELCTRYSDMFMDKINEVYDCVADVLYTVFDLFKGYGNYRTVNVPFTRENPVWSVIDAPTFITILEKHMGTNFSLQMNYQIFINRFYGYLLDNIDIWNGMEADDIVKEINQFLLREFNPVLGNNMDYYVDMVVNHYGGSLAQYYDFMFRALNSQSAPMFPVSSVYYTNVPQPIYSIVSVPRNASSARVGASANVSKMSNIYNSSINDRICKMTFENGIPLCAYADMPVYYATYVYQASHSPGLHLYETKEHNWHDLPSPYPESEWVNGYYVEKEATENKGWREVFDKAKAYGYIEWNDYEREYICKWGELIKANEILAMEKVDLDDELTDLASVRKCFSAIEDVMIDEARLTNQKAIYDTKFKMEAGELIPDDAYAKNIFIKMVRVRNEIKRRVEDHDQALEVLEKLKKYSVMDDMMYDYLRLFYTETISRLRYKYSYRDENGQSQEFALLMGEEKDYPDYHLFHRLMNMNEIERKDLLKLSEDNYYQKQKTDEDYDAMEEKLEDIAFNLKRVIVELKGEWDEIDDGQKILQFYCSLYDMAMSILKEF